MTFERLDSASIAADPRLNCSELHRVMKLLASLNVASVDFRSAETGER